MGQGDDYLKKFVTEEIRKKNLLKEFFAQPIWDVFKEGLENAVKNVQRDLDDPQVTDIMVVQLHRGEKRAYKKILGLAGQVERDLKFLRYEEVQGGQTGGSSDDRGTEDTHKVRGPRTGRDVR